MYNSKKDIPVKIKTEVTTTISLYKQNKFYKKESGGILMGYLLKENGGVVLSKVTTPQKYDIQKRFYFYRDNRIHQDLFNIEWKQSKKTISYLGEWHTHPENYPTPSSKDYKNWKKLLKETTYLGNSLFFIICGLKEIGVWKGLRNTKNILKIGEIKI